MAKANVTNGRIKEINIITHLLIKLKTNIKKKIISFCEEHDCSYSSCFLWVSIGLGFSGDGGGVCCFGK